MELQKVPFISKDYLQKVKKQSNVLDGARGCVHSVEMKKKIYILLKQNTYYESTPEFFY